MFWLYDGGYGVMRMMMVFKFIYLFLIFLIFGFRGIFGIIFGIMDMRETIMGLMARACKMMVG